MGIDEDGYIRGYMGRYGYDESIKSPEKGVIIRGTSADNNTVNLDNRTITYNINININIPENVTKEQLQDIKSVLLNATDTLKNSESGSYQYTYEDKKDVESKKDGSPIKRRWFG